MSFASRLQREWLAPGLLSALLLPLSWLYGAVVRWRADRTRPALLPVPVIVVGNWIVGGAGKTPTTLALLRMLEGVRIGVVSRGYGRSSDEVHLLTRESSASEAGDEPLLIHLRCGVPVAVGRDRVAAARALLGRHPDLQLLISDDGLQHPRLPRALSVLVFDERGLGNGRLLPAGPLREPARATRPDEIVLYNAKRPSTPLPGFFARRQLGGAVALDAWWRGEPASLDALYGLRGRPLVAAAGMAQPQRFFDMLTELGLGFTPLALPDHHRFATLPWPAGTGDVLLTEKDAVKLRPEQLGSTRAWVVTLDFQPEPDFEALLRERVLDLLS
ncbi:MAG: tetraacyldisaccharide 4'-kinase [Paucibacter sp.]|nr:tetraacyldisaccharide 4'-kinase [Roseateles sp.]